MMEFLAELESLGSPGRVAAVARFFKGGAQAPDNEILGVPIGKVFPLAKKFSHLSLAETEELLDSPYYEARMGAVAIMDFKARAKTTTEAEREALFDLYLRRHDRINNWDLVDRAAPHVVGRHLKDRDRRVLYSLARSANPWERRTAIVSTYYFIRDGELDDTFRIAEILLADGHEYVQKAVGSWLREAGKKDERRLIAFLEKHAARMPRGMLRTATEKLEKGVRSRILESAGPVE